MAVNGHGQVSKPATFAIIVKDGKGQEHQRAVPLEVKSSYTAELLAIKYGLLTLSSKDCSVQINVSKPNIIKALTKVDGEWPKSKNNNKSVDDVRLTIDGFRKIQFIHDKEDEDLERVKEMSKIVRP